MSIARAKVEFIEPMLALAVTKLPEGPAWSYELKFDGYRALGIKAAGRVRLLSRNDRDSPQHAPEEPPRGRWRGSKLALAKASAEGQTVLRVRTGAFRPSENLSAAGMLASVCWSDRPRVG